MLTKMIERGRGGLREDEIVYGNENVYENENENGNVMVEPR